MGKSIFPLRSDFEDNKYEDIDAHFKTLPYYKEIPELHTESFKLPPLPFFQKKYTTCREHVATIGFYSFLIGWFFISKPLARAWFGGCVTRYRMYKARMLAGVGFSMLNMTAIANQDISCSPYFAGRRRPMFTEEAIRHALDARYNLYQNMDRILMSKTSISKYDFFDTFEKGITNK
jgi:hypothetical protein